ncbi:hypothetical protein ACLB2K_040247 [Fragaria x ananassa]
MGVTITIGVALMPLLTSLFLPTPVTIALSGRLQTCGDTSCCHVMHIIHSGIPPSLSAVTSSKSFNFEGLYDVGAGIANDAVKVFKDFNLLKPNKIRLGNWETKYLSKEQLPYAATDAFASWYLHEVLRSLPDAEEGEKVAADNQSKEQDVSCNYCETEEPQAATL